MPKKKVSETLEEKVLRIRAKAEKRAGRLGLQLATAQLNAAEALKRSAMTLLDQVDAAMGEDDE